MASTEVTPPGRPDASGGPARQTRTVRRPLGAWLVLALVWLVGLAVWVVYLALLGMLLIRVLA